MNSHHFVILSYTNQVFGGQVWSTRRQRGESLFRTHWRDADVGRSDRLRKKSVVIWDPLSGFGSPLVGFPFTKRRIFFTGTTVHPWWNDRWRRAPRHFPSSVARLGSMDRPRLVGKASYRSFPGGIFPIDSMLGIIPAIFMWWYNQTVCIDIWQERSWWPSNS